MENQTCELPETRVRKRSRIEIFWDKTSKFEKKLLIMLVFAVLLLNIFLYLLTIEIAVLPKSCTTPGCLIAAAQIITYVDTTIDPCEDFFNFACGNYLHNTHGHLKPSPIEKLQELVKNQVKEIIKEPIKDDDHDLIKNQKMLHKACMNETAVEEDSMKILKEMLDELNGWPVVIGLQWNQSLFDWTKMIYKLRQKGYNHMMMLTIGPVIDPRNDSQYIIRIEEPFVRIREKYKQHYKTYMTEVAVTMGAERLFAEREVEKVLDFMEKLKIIGKKNRWRVENVKDIEVAAELILSTTFTVEEFQKRNNEVDWLKFINGILYPSVNISSDEYVIFPKNDFLEGFFTLLAKAPKRTQANYIIWSFLENYIQFMSKELQKIRANYILQTQGTSCPEDRFEFCRDETRAMMFPEPTDILYLRKYLTTEKQKKVRTLFSSIKSEFVLLLKDTSWMDYTSKENSLEKLYHLSEIIGTIGNYFDDAIFEDYVFSTKKYFETDSFLKMYLSCAKDKTDAKYSVIHKTNISTKLLTHQTMITMVNAIYFPEENVVFLPAGILQGMLYDGNRPMYLNYGAIGSIIGHEITHGFCKAANEYNGENTSKIWTNQTEEAYEEKSKCVIENAESFENKINGTQTLEENIADFTGFKVSYAAYKKWVETNGEEPQLPGIIYNPYQLFWISAVNLHCYQLKTSEFHEKVHRDNHALNVFRATVPIRNNPDFAKDFKCPLGSKMNPLEKCQIF